MQTVYIVGIIAAAIVIVVVVWMLRGRLKSASGEASLKDKSVKGKVEAFAPQRSSASSPSERQPSVEVTGNVMIGGVVRVWRNSVRVARNWLVGKGTKVEVGETSAARQRSPAVKEQERKQG